MIGRTGSYSGALQEQLAEPRRVKDARNTSAASGACSDEVLMTAYLGGDMSAFAELFKRYTPILQRMLWRSLRDEVPDFVQQTFLHVHRARGSFKVGAPFRPWLVSIAMNLKREHFRRVQRRLALEPELYRFAATAPSQPDISCEADRTCRAIEALPDRERQVLELLCGGGLSADDVATEMRTTTSGVKSLAHRARQRLRERCSLGFVQSDCSNTGIAGSSR